MIGGRKESAAMFSLLDPAYSFCRPLRRGSTQHTYKMLRLKQ